MTDDRQEIFSDELRDRLDAIERSQVDIGERLDTIAELLADLSGRIGQPPRRWLTIAQAAEYAGLSVESMRRLLAAGRMTTHRPTPGRIAIDRLALDQYMLGATRCPRVRRGTAAADAARRRANR